MQIDKISPQQHALDLLEVKRKEYGSVLNWLQWRRENEPGFTELIEYNPDLEKPIPKFVQEA